MGDDLLWGAEAIRHSGEDASFLGREELSTCCVQGPLEAKHWLHFNLPLAARNGVSGALSGP